MNIWVRDKVSRQRRTALYDFEFVHRTFRGIDLGFLFVNVMVKWDGREDKRSGHDYPSIDFRRRFIQVYLEEGQKLGLYSVTRSGRDSVDHVLRESLLGSMLQCVYSMSWMSWMWDKLLDNEPSFIGLLSFFREVYEMLERELRSNLV